MSMQTMYGCKQARERYFAITNETKFEIIHIELNPKSPHFSTSHSFMRMLRKRAHIAIKEKALMLPLAMTKHFV